MNRRDFLKLVVLVPIAGLLAKLRNNTPSDEPVITGLKTYHRILEDPWHPPIRYASEIIKPGNFYTVAYRWDKYDGSLFTVNGEPAIDDMGLIRFEAEKPSPEGTVVMWGLEKLT